MPIVLYARTNQDYDNNATRNPYAFETLLRAKPINRYTRDSNTQDTNKTLKEKKN